MAENKKVSSVSFFNSRLTSVISISLVLFLLGLILLIGMLGNKLSVYVKENLSFSIVLKDNQKETEIKKMQKSLQSSNGLPKKRQRLTQVRYIKAQIFLNPSAAGRRQQCPRSAAFFISCTMVRAA